MKQKLTVRMTTTQAIKQKKAKSNLIQAYQILLKGEVKHNEEERRNLCSSLLSKTKGRR